MSMLDNLFINLRVISKIPEGGRISTTKTNQIKIEDTKTLNGWLSKGRRSLNGDSRDETVKVLMQIFNDVNEITENIIDSIKTTPQQLPSASLPVLLHENSKKFYQLEKLSKMLKSSEKGIRNLQKTYVNDANVIATFDELIDKIESLHKSINQILSWMTQGPEAKCSSKEHQHPLHQPQNQPSQVQVLQQLKTESDSDNDSTHLF